MGTGQKEEEITQNYFVVGMSVGNRYQIHSVFQCYYYRLEMTAMNLTLFSTNCLEHR
jgi:hypothetical protein